MIMAQVSDHAIQPSFSIGSQFIKPQELKVIVDKYPCGNLVITDDVKHQILLKVKPYNSRFHIQRMLLDANDQPIMMLRKMNLSMHSRWNVFRGESKASSDLIFTTKTECMIQLKTNVSVLANKMSNKDDFDLRIKGDWSEGNCTIYREDSSTVIAEMHKSQALKYAKDKFTVTIEANMDYARVVALVAIVDATEHPEENQGLAEAAGGVLDVIGSVLLATLN